MKTNPLPMAARRISDTMGRVCDVCGRLRGATLGIDHSKCSKIRQQRGFDGGAS